MELFKTLNKIEDGVRRGDLEKSKTEKMGVPHVMGAGDRSEVLSDQASAEKESECDDTEEKSSCEKDAGLLSAMNFMGAARQGGVAAEEAVDKAVVDPKHKRKKPQAIPEGKLNPTERRMREAAARSTEEGDETSAKKPAKKAGTKKKSKGKKPEGGSSKGKSGSGSGQGGRTGSRQRRSVGEFWYAKSGNRPGTDLWTKRENGTIVRANAEEKKKYEAARKKQGLPEGSELETGPEDEHKKRSKMVRKIKKAAGLHKHMTKESRAKVLAALRQAGFKISDKEEEFLNRFMDEACSFKLSTGNPSQWARKPEQVKRDFVDGMDPQNYKNLQEFNKAKKRIESMNIDQFEAVFRSIMLDEDEDALREAFGIKGSWKGVNPKKEFDEALGEIIKTMY